MKSAGERSSAMLGQTAGESEAMDDFDAILNVRSLLSREELEEESLTRAAPRGPVEAPAALARLRPEPEEEAAPCLPEEVDTGFFMAALPELTTSFDDNDDWV